MGTTGVFLDLEETGGRIARLGSLWILANILSFLPIIAIIAMPFSVIDFLIETSSIPMFMMAILIGTVDAEGVIMLIVLFATMELRQYTDDSRFYTGSVICIISIIAMIVTMPIIFLMLISSSEDIIFQLFSLMAITGLLGVLGLIGLILLMVALHELGSSNDISMLSLGAILIILFPIIAGFLIGFGLKELGNRLQMGMEYTAIKELKEKLLSTKYPVDIKFLAKSQGLAPLALRMILVNLITKKELPGYIKKYTYYPL